MDGNLADMFGNTYVAQIQNFSTIYHLVFRNVYGPVDTVSFEEEGISSIRAIPQYRMDPMVGSAIKTLPDFEE